MKKTCFISYSWDSRAHSVWVESLARDLEGYDVKVVFDRNRQDNLIGVDLFEFMKEGIQKSDYVVVIVTPNYVERANGILGGVGMETLEIRNRLLNEERRHPPFLFPLLKEGGQRPAYMHDLHYLDFRESGEYGKKLSDLLLQIGVLDDGIALRDAVFDEDNPLPGKVFAIELLETPIRIANADGQFTVSVRRDNIRLGVFTVKGREEIVKRAFPDSASLKNANAVDIEIHKLLLGRNNGTILVNQKHMRWASGGVLLRVKYRGRWWFTFFFRDIPPYGWNISLGGSEHEDELLDPWKFLMREFLEETLICCRSPNRNEQVLRRQLIFDHLDINQAIEKAEIFSQKHRSLRFERDGLDFARNAGVPVECQTCKTKTSICIDGGPNIRNVLVCVSLTELGIEVLKVLECEINENDFILDGEIYEPSGVRREDGCNIMELVRMPMALISEEYLKRAFGKSKRAGFKYLSPFGAVLPSVKGIPLQSEDIQVFPYDVIRRVALARNEDGNATEWERKRYRMWLDQFGENFLDKNGNPTNTTPSCLFTPASAKAMAYYFANI